jgi:hypothetical protein
MFNWDLLIRHLHIAAGAVFFHVTAPAAAADESPLAHR